MGASVSGHLEKLLKGARVMCGVDDLDGEIMPVVLLLPWSRPCPAAAATRFVGFMFERPGWYPGKPWMCEATWECVISGDEADTLERLLIEDVKPLLPGVL